MATQMRKSSTAEEQIIAVLAEQEHGTGGGLPSPRHELVNLLQVESHVGRYGPRLMLES